MLLITDLNVSDFSFQAGEQAERLKTICGDKGKIEDFIREIQNRKEKSIIEACEKINTSFGKIFATLLPGACAKLVAPKSRSGEATTVLDGLEVCVVMTLNSQTVVLFKRVVFCQYLCQQEYASYGRKTSWIFFTIDQSGLRQRVEGISSGAEWWAKISSRTVSYLSHVGLQACAHLYSR